MPRYAQKNFHQVKLQYKDDSININLNGSEWIQLCKDSKEQLIDTSHEEQILTIEYSGEIKLDFSIKVMSSIGYTKHNVIWSENQILKWCRKKHLAIEADN